MTDVATLTAADAQELERSFLSGLNDAQDAYERIIAAEAWTALGHDSFAEWWSAKVQPSMRALSMRPTKEIASAAIARVKSDEAALPPAQRRRDSELADMVGVDQKTVSNWSRSTVEETSSDVDLEDPNAPESAGAVTAPLADSGTTDEPVSGISDTDPAPNPSSAHGSTPPPNLRPADSDAKRALDEALALDSARRAAITGLTKALTFLNPVSVAPAKLAAEYAWVLDEFEQRDLDRAAETMTAIATLKRGM